MTITVTAPKPFLATVLEKRYPGYEFLGPEVTMPPEGCAKWTLTLGIKVAAANRRNYVQTLIEDADDVAPETVLEMGKKLAEWADARPWEHADHPS